MRTSTETTKETKVNIKQNEEAAIGVEIIAECITAIADGIKKVRAGKLNERALILLIQHASPNVGTGFRTKRPVTAKEVKAVLAGLDNLQREYLKPAAKK